jgi:hypothetical protein
MKLILELPYSNLGQYIEHFFVRFFSCFRQIQGSASHEGMTLATYSELLKAPLNNPLINKMPFCMAINVVCDFKERTCNEC